MKIIKKLKLIWNIIKPYIPMKIIPLLLGIFNKFMKIFCKYLDIRDKAYIKKTGFKYLPPAFLRYCSAGDPDVVEFLKVGKQCSQDIGNALKRINRDLNSFQNILDFGCGCGRTLIRITKYPQFSKFYGTDIDNHAIFWCHNNLKFTKFNNNKPLPPLKYPSEMFDLIYAISVFTHLNENYQFKWLNELKRITKPGAILLLTINGRYSKQYLPHRYMAKIEDVGFLFIDVNICKGIFPEWYQNAYHTKEYIFKNYIKYFKILDYIPRGMNNHQDLIILQKRKEVL